MVARSAQKRLRDLFTLYDNWRYLFWRLSRSDKRITVSLKNRQKIILRASPTTDLALAYEIFLAEAYQKPSQVPEISPRFIVDIGANIGYSIIYFAYQYPHANFVAFEPHPSHLKLIDQHLKINPSLVNKVHIEKSAVSNIKAEMFLSDAGDESRIMENSIGNCLSVQVCDFFTWIGSQAVDLLKIDIEGGEYAILNDARFATINISTIVIEWHNTEQTPDGYQWCLERLSSLGYKITDGKIKLKNAGILWAWKN